MDHNPVQKTCEGYRHTFLDHSSTPEVLRMLLLPLDERARLNPVSLLLAHAL